MFVYSEEDPLLTVRWMCVGECVFLRMIVFQVISMEVDGYRTSVISSVGVLQIDR